MKVFNKERGIADIFNLLSVILGVVSIICYFLSGSDASKMTETEVSVIVYLPLILSLVASLLGFVLKSKMINIIAFILYFLSLMLWGVNQAGYIVNVLMGTDGNSFSFAYITDIICIIAAMILSLLSTMKNKTHTNTKA